ncbi:MAG: hotdog fold thioesterase [Thermoproteota archaeon]|jgi:acyl-CoA thioesterase
MEVKEKVFEVIKEDNYSRFLGIKCLEIKKGYAKYSMVVNENMINFHNVAHGGAIFSLADAAFAAASNSEGIRSLALVVEICYRRPVHVGEEIIAEAKEESGGKRTAVYSIRVYNKEGETIALCQATVYRTGEKLISD